MLYLTYPQPYGSELFVDVKCGFWSAGSQFREDDAIYLFTSERTFDAFAQDELRELGLDRKMVIEAMVQKVLSMLV